ncbi:MAG: hypothetical protein LBH40_04180 [Alphaproteobacteria bacterium]|nr:hypothetical protein [Alphaproteobacteria bacterium]
MENDTNTNTQNEENLNNQDNDLDLILQKLENLWGEDLDKNLLLSKRGLAWIGLDEETQTGDFNEIVFLNKMVDLGKLLSEDEIVSSNWNDFSLSPSEAKKLRLKMTSQKDILEALNNKGNIRHKDVLSQINRLNEIIANG